MGFAFSKLWTGLFAAEDNFKVSPTRVTAVARALLLCALRRARARAGPLAARCALPPLTARRARRAQIIIVGLNNAGKTTILYKLCVRLALLELASLPGRSGTAPGRVGRDSCRRCSAALLLMRTRARSHLGEVVVTQPTIGSNVEEINYKNVKFQVWDLGGQVRQAAYAHATNQAVAARLRARLSVASLCASRSQEKLRPSWSTYYSDTNVCH